MKKNLQEFYDDIWSKRKGKEIQCRSLDSSDKWVKSNLCRDDEIYLDSLKEALEVHEFRLKPEPLEIYKEALVQISRNNGPHRPIADAALREVEKLNNETTLTGDK